MRKREVCTDCRRTSPETDTTYTLISARYGWRLTRIRDADGRAIVEWRCPDCWKRFKEATGAGASVPPAPMPKRTGKE